MTAHLVHEYVDAILRAYRRARSADEREEIAKEIARLTSGGIRESLSEMAGRDLQDTKGDA